jgi:hypothetical protein
MRERRLAALSAGRKQLFTLPPWAAAMGRWDLKIRHLLKYLATAIPLACLSTSAFSEQPQQQPTPRSRDTRGNEERAAHFICLSQTTAAYSNYEGPQAAREAGEAAYLMSCVIHVMPEDWRSAELYRKKAENFAEMARQSDPQMDKCLLEVCSTEPK